MKSASYLVFLALNQIFLICYLNSLDLSKLNDYFQLNHSHIKRKHFRKHPTRHQVENKHKPNVQFVFYKRSKDLKYKRKNGKYEGDILNRHQSKDLNYNHNKNKGIKNDGQRHVSKKSQKKYHKKIVNHEDLFNDGMINNNMNDGATNIVFDYKRDKSNKSYYSKWNRYKFNHLDELFKTNFNFALNFQTKTTTIKNYLDQSEPVEIFFDNIDGNDLYHNGNIIEATTKISRLNGKNLLKNDKDDEIVLFANFSLTKNNKKDLMAKKTNEINEYYNNEKFSNDNLNYFNNITNATLNNLNNFNNLQKETNQMDTYNKMILFDKNFNNFEQLNSWNHKKKIKLNDKSNINQSEYRFYELLDSMQPINSHDIHNSSVVETSKNYKNFIESYRNRRRNIDEDENNFKKNSLSLLNYLALGLIFFLVILQLMLLVCPSQRKKFKKNLNSKWKKYRNKISKSNKYSKTSSNSSSSLSAKSYTSLICLPEKSKFKSSKSTGKKKISRPNNLEYLPLRKSLKVEKIANNKIKNGDKIISSRELSNDEMKINLNETSIHKNEEINLKISNHPSLEKLNLFNKQAILPELIDDFKNSNEKLKNDRKIHLKDKSSESLELIDIKMSMENQINKPVTKLTSPIINTITEPQITKLPSPNIDTATEPQITKLASSNNDKMKLYKPVSEIKHSEVDSEIKTKSIAKIEKSKKSSENSPKDIEKKIDKKDSNTEKQNDKIKKKENNFKKEKYETESDDLKKKKKNIEKIPVNWLTIIGNKRVYKENIALFEKGDKINVLRLKPPHFKEL